MVILCTLKAREIKEEIIRFLIPKILDGKGIFIEGANNEPGERLTFFLLTVLRYAIYLVGKGI